jgi:hypothetical protein
MSVTQQPHLSCQYFVLLKRTMSSSVSIVTRLLVGRPINHASISGRGNGFSLFTAPKEEEKDSCLCRESKRDSSFLKRVWIATSYGLDCCGSSPGRGKRFSLFHSIQAASGPIHPPIQWVPRSVSPGVKRPEREADHSPLSNAEVKNGTATSSIPHTSSWLGVYLIKHRDNFKLFPYSFQTGSGGPKWVPRAISSLVKQSLSELTTHLHRIPRLKMRGSMLQFPHPPLCRSVQLTTAKILYFSSQKRVDSFMLRSLYPGETPTFL